MLPFGGQGATMAMQSAVALANLLFEMQNITEPEIARVFQQYYNARSRPGKLAVNSSHQTGSVMHMRGAFGNAFRYIGFNWMPRWAMKKGMDSYNGYKEQISFLPFAKFRGTFVPRTNKPSRQMIPESNVAVVV
jgi:2-polyprenyl-6-methoxyphenol hydroxylase-like FAD-dependent oxidoreductase